MKIKQVISNFVNRMFNDEVIDVQPPREWWVEYKDVGKRLEGYIVSVTYKYRGWCDTYSIIDNDHFQLISPKQALKNATRFYNKTRQKISAAKLAHLNENIK